MADIEFIAECNADTVLLEVMGIHLKHINHADTNSKIGEAMKKQADNYKKTLVGLTDLDKKNIPAYFDSFEEIKNDHDIFYKEKKDTKHFLIFLKPAIEGWVLKEAKSANISPADFGFPLDVKALKKITTSETIKNNPKFREFLRAIKSKQSSGFLFLKDIIAMHYPIFEA